MGFFFSDMKHYYTDNTDLKTEPSYFTFQYKEKEILFKSDHGVFSKSRVDYGSKVLLESIYFSKHTKSLLDVGCGYGTLGICMKKANPDIDVTMIDVNNRALDLCKENCKQNDVDATVKLSNGYENVTETFDMIMTNPPIRAGKQVVFQILEGAIDHLNEQGSLWVVVQKKQGAPSVKKKLIEIFNNCTTVKKIKDIIF